MAKQHKFQTNFSSGVISENAQGRIDTAIYNSGLKIGENIIIENPGGATRRPGTLFVYEFAEDFVELIPFSFNTEQTYLLAFTEYKLEIFLSDFDGIPQLVASLTTPYEVQNIKEMDYAQSADTMVITHTDHPPQGLRRLGSDVAWELLSIPFVSEPTELICVDGAKPLPNGSCSDASTPTEEKVWGLLNGYPKYCTFFQGRLYLAATRLLPQHVWGSVSQDFFNFALGAGDDGDAIYDILDTDFINPIVAIYAEKKLFVFSTGDEFVNNAGVITPIGSAWVRVSKNGSFGTVRPISLDGGVLYLDRSGRTMQTLKYNDNISGFESKSVSLYSEHLIQAPIDIGIMKGSLFQASNFLYIVNAAGTVAVLNLSEAVGMAAWTLWKTQGAFRSVLTFNNEVTYVLVERRSKWILEKLQTGIYVDSGSEIQTQVVPLKPDPVTHNGEVVTHNGQIVTYGLIPGLDTGDAIGDRNNFYGVSYDTRGYGRVIIIADGVEVYRQEHFKKDPLQTKLIFGRYIKPINSFAQDSAVEDLYFSAVPQTEFYMYSLLFTNEANSSQNFIDGLPHLIGREVVVNLDGSVFHNQLVVPGNLLPGGGLIKDYPDGEDWLFNTNAGQESYLVRFVDNNNVTTLIEGYYQGVLYTPLTINEFWNAFPITQEGEPVLDDEFLEQGVFVEEFRAGNVIVDYNAISGDYPGTVTGSNGSFTFTPLDGVTKVKICMAGGGGSGTAEIGSFGGFAGEMKSQEITLARLEAVSIKVGLAKQSSSFKNITAAGGADGSTILLGYTGNGASRTTCAGTTRDGLKGDTTVVEVFAWGGQAGVFGNGGKGGNNFGSAGSPGGIGAGGGGRYNGIGGGIGGPGGNGRIIISWEISQRKYRIRKTKLQTAAVPITDGIVETDRTFNTAQAGLQYSVNMQTLPLEVATKTNEPKRIVSVMARFVETAGLNIANNPLPEREFGEEVLDAPPPKKSGIQKIRLFGYTRETTIRITQYDPLPMTLTSLDIEIKVG